MSQERLEMTSVFEAPGELSRTPRRMAVPLSRLWKPLVGRGYFTGL